MQRSCFMCKQTDKPYLLRSVAYCTTCNEIPEKVDDFHNCTFCVKCGSYVYHQSYCLQHVPPNLYCWGCQDIHQDQPIRKCTGGCGGQYCSDTIEFYQPPLKDPEAQKEVCLCEECYVMYLDPSKKENL